MLEGIELGDVEVPRKPRTRGECDRMRPCLFVSCKYHLYLDVNPDTGSIKLNFPHLEVDELEHTCCLAVAEEGDHTLEMVGEITNLTRERIRQLEVRALMKLRGTEEMAQHIEPVPSPPPPPLRLVPLPLPSTPVEPEVIETDLEVPEPARLLDTVATAHKDDCALLMEILEHTPPGELSPEAKELWGALYDKFEEMGLSEEERDIDES